MSPAGGPRILLCTDAPPAADDLQQFLEKGGYGLVRHPLDDSGPADVGRHHAVVVEGSRANGQALRLCRHLRARLGEAFVPILYVAADLTPAARLASLESGADGYLLRPFAVAELLAQLQSLVRLKERHDRLVERTAEVQRVNQCLQRAHEQIDQEMELAHRIQRSFLPRSLPELPRTHFAVYHRPAGRVGGDSYDVFRLDERHVGLYVADAVGHGVPASLLTVFVKKGITTKEIRGQDYRLLPPNEVLRRLNRDLLAEALSGNPFITMVYMVLDHQGGTLQYSRSGHPYPLHVPRNGEPEALKVPGSLMGVFDTEFPLETRQLQPGDKVLLFTDGMDAATYDGYAAGTPSVVAWAARHRTLPIDRFVNTMACQLFQGTAPADDLTFLGLEFLPEHALAG